MSEEKKYPIGGYAPGSYLCKCGSCEKTFMGDKRAFQCEPCAVGDEERFNAMTPEEQQELLTRNAEIFRKVWDEVHKK